MGAVVKYGTAFTSCYILQIQHALVPTPIAVLHLRPKRCGHNPPKKMAVHMTPLYVLLALVSVTPLVQTPHISHGTEAAATHLWFSAFLGLSTPLFQGALRGGSSLLRTQDSDHHGKTFCPWETIVLNERGIGSGRPTPGNICNHFAYLHRASTVAGGHRYTWWQLLC